MFASEGFPRLAEAPPRECDLPAKASPRLAEAPPRERAADARRPRHPPG
jgi:hypothetical protein